MERKSIINRQEYNQCYFLGCALLVSFWIESRNSSASTFHAGSYVGFVVGYLDLVSLGASMKVATCDRTTKQEEAPYNDFIRSSFRWWKNNLIKK